MLEEQCKDIESLHIRENTKSMHKKIDEILGKKTMIIKSKDRKIPIEREEQLTRWAEYIGELYGDDFRQEDFFY